MKLKKTLDIDEFFKAIDSCKGTVELISDEGDRLNLKSKLSQYISLGKVLSDGNIDKLEVVASEPEDVKKLRQFVVDSGRVSEGVSDMLERLKV